MAPLIDLADLCEAWQLPPVLSAWTPEAGTVHQTLLLRTAERSYALRQYRYTADDRWRIASEHALTAYVRAQGLPALPPVPLPNGETMFELGGYFYALFPFAPGHQIARGHLTSSEVIAIGAFLAQLHSVLYAYPSELVPRRSLRVDHQIALAKMDEIESAIRRRPRGDDGDQDVLARLAHRRTLLTTMHPVNMQELAQLEQQVIHGDYQETNLFFAEGKVSAIIDWDQAYTAPRAWEIVRTLHYALNLEAAPCRLFLDAYRRISPLAPAELDIAAAAYGWKRAHDLWLYEELYLRENERVQALLQPGESPIPFAERWAEVRRSLF